MLPESLLWLALNVHHEARGEPHACQVMVAEVTLRRVDSKYYPNTVEGVVLNSRQFTWTANKKLQNFKYVTKEDMAVAIEASLQYYYTQTEMHYARYEIDNYWTKTMTATMQCGDHVFYDNGGKP